MHTISRTRAVFRQAVMALTCALAGLGSAGAGDVESQAGFAAPGDALAALQAAVQSNDTNALCRIFGPALSEIANPDKIQGASQLRMFARHLGEFTELSSPSNETVVLRLGTNHWPFPIPLVLTNGQWRFDTRAGKEEILNRRIGRNELSAIEVCQAYVDAQREYATKDRAGSGVMEYAQRLRSKPGTKDGLYWETADGEPESPLGPLVAQAQAEGYYKARTEKPGEPKGCTPFHGYLFRILKKQGRDAPGGKYDYVVNGHMVAGFGLLAYPVEWGNSGIMTFVVNQQGVVYQKNLGERTGELAPRIEAYDPDETWRVAE